MFKFKKYNTFFYYNINYLFVLSLRPLFYIFKKKLNYIKKFKHTFRYLLYVNSYIYKFNFFLYFFKNQLKNSLHLNVTVLNFSSFKSLKNLYIC